MYKYKTVFCCYRLLSIQNRPPHKTKSDTVVAKFVEFFFKITLNIIHIISLLQLKMFTDFFVVFFCLFVSLAYNIVQGKEMKHRQRETLRTGGGKQVFPFTRMLDGTDGGKKIIKRSFILLGNNVHYVDTTKRRKKKFK